MIYFIFSRTIKPCDHNIKEIRENRPVNNIPENKICLDVIQSVLAQIKFKLLNFSSIYLSNRCMPH